MLYFTVKLDLGVLASTHTKDKAVFTLMSNQNEQNAGMFSIPKLCTTSFPF